jgi:hypothetical protein
LYGLRLASGTSAGGAAVAVTVSAPGSSQRHYLEAVACSYSATPTGGGLTSTGLVGDELDVHVPGTGPVTVDCHGAPCEAGTALVVTLAAPGGAVVGKVVVWYRTLG